MHALQRNYWAVRDYLSPVLKESKFKEHGRITPEEFVAAGDFLTYKFPVWTWEKGDASKARDYLPPDKQYLVTRGVPCLRRAASLAYTDADEDTERLLNFAEGNSPDVDGDEWVETHTGRKTTTENVANAGEIDEIPDLDGPSDAAANAMANLSLASGGNAPAGGDTPDLDEIPDMEEDLEGEEDEATAAPPKLPPKGIATANEPDSSRANLLQVRTYDVMITYDKYYQTPCVWLLGYDENGTPLKPPQIFEDISADHAFKTVTIDPFQHSTSLQAALVHPCKHASVMKKIIERMNNSVIEEQRKNGNISIKDKDNKKKWSLKRMTSGTKDDKGIATPAEEDDVEGMRVDYYLVVFLKFIASIVPTIEVDSTTAF